MEVEKLVSFIRGSCIVQDPFKGVENDPFFLEMTDEEIINILEIMFTSINPHADINNIPDKDIYPLTLLVKREIYSRLSIKEAPNIDIKSGKDSVSQSDRFEHYMSLIKDITKQYDDYLSRGTEIQVGEVFLTNRYYSHRYYNNAEPPSIGFNVDEVGEDYLSISWSVDIKNRNRFLSYDIYYKKGEELIYDEYSKQLDTEVNTNKISFKDIHHKKHKIEGLIPNTFYSICIIAREMNGLYGFSQGIIKTGGE